MHAVEPNEHLRICEFDHLQQTLDVFKHIHAVVRNKPLFGLRKSQSTEVRDPNAFFLEDHTKDHSDRFEEQSVFDRDEQHFAKLIASKVG